MALLHETVTVTDPTHPLCGLTLPLVGITVMQRLGRVCIVELYPGIERAIPFAATSRAEVAVGCVRSQTTRGGHDRILVTWHP